VFKRVTLNSIAFIVRLARVKIAWAALDRSVGRSAGGGRNNKISLPADNEVRQHQQLRGKFAAAFLSLSDSVLADALAQSQGERRKQMCARAQLC
jgi:hypothetical protein